MPQRLLVWTENYWVGGSDRFLADFLEGLDGELSVLLAGNPHPEFDAWLAARMPWALPRATVRVANLVDSPLARLRGRLAQPSPQLAEELPQSAPFSPLAAGTAALRYRAALVNYLRLRRLVRSARPDAVLINNGGYPGAESCRVLALAAQAEAVPRIVQFVHNMAYPPAWPEPAERALDARVDRAQSAWATAAERASDALAAQRGLPRERVRTVHYGIPAPPPATAGFDRGALRAELAARPDGFVAAVVAAFEPRKGHGVLLRALHAAPGAQLALVGSGPEEQRLRSLTDELGLAERVRFLGWRDDVDAILRASDALVLPSLGNECLPYAILEAMSHGLPAIGTDVAGIPEEIEHGVTGLVVPPGDERELGVALASVAADPERARAMGEAGRRRQRELFDRSRMVGAVLELLGA